jgi:hypothetical protein
VAAAYGVKPIQGILMHEMRQYVMSAR